MQTLVLVLLLLAWWLALRPRRANTQRNFDQGMRALDRLWRKGR